MPSSPAEEAVRKAPLSPSHPSQEGPSTPSAEGVSRPAPGPVSPRNVEKEFNEIPTRVAVSYKTEGQKEVVKKRSSYFTTSSGKESCRRNACNSTS